MIESLRISNFALLESASMNLGEGMNVVTGETGAGKSILVGALSMVLGERVGREIVGENGDYCEVEAVFAPPYADGIKDYLKKKGLGENELFLRRLFYKKGRSRCFINDRRVTVSTLNELGNTLVDIHSQNQHQRILKKNEQLKILDIYGHCEKERKDVRDAWMSYSELKSEKDALDKRSRQVNDEIERIQYELKEIDSLSLSPGIEEEVDSEYKKLKNARELTAGAGSLYSTLYEAEGSVSEILSHVSLEVQELAEIDKDLLPVYEAVSEAENQVEAAAEILREYGREEFSDEGRLEELMNVRDRISSLKIKYSCGIEGVIERGNKLRGKVDDFENYDIRLKKLEEELESAFRQYEKAASALSGKREKAARSLSDKVNEKLDFLCMPGAFFEVRLEKKEPGPGGDEGAEFYIRTNPGGKMMKISKIASGGEVSRIMLAIKSALADADDIPVLVFDEIDAGIGATTARAVGKELKKLSEFHQVIAVTHLAQIAGKSDTHIKVKKETVGKKTVTRIEKLGREKRLREISRMYAGRQDEATLSHARRFME